MCRRGFAKAAKPPPFQGMRDHPVRWIGQKRAKNLAVVTTLLNTGLALTISSA
jgi:hypothetical protein